ncbi:hypothetical protein [Rhizobium sp. SL86]|jgi:hypothetical protein|uniref:hypothetical protein n=1 Tax=Rhizobium sp. SL86 TaxID=2995148 RepID=UPI0022762506|nr:hypothetical protein [Rhizobium sp. SL86]MCY1664344.1 hypothetical protein [Rhizobium sp. SL86]
MSNEDQDEKPQPAEPRRRMRLPPIIKPEDRGVGDVIARLAESAGITPCGGCRERQQRLNNWMPFRHS